MADGPTCGQGVWDCERLHAGALRGLGASSRVNRSSNGVGFGVTALRRGGYRHDGLLCYTVLQVPKRMSHGNVNDSTG